MSNAFQGEQTFNEDISAWDTSKVTDMSNIFNKATAFNQNISSWQTGKVTNMNAMFSYAIAFNQNISSWSVDLVVYCTFFAFEAGALTPPNFPSSSDCTAP